jgi:hypothetical protein
MMKSRHSRWTSNGTRDTPTVAPVERISDAAAGTEGWPTPTPAPKWSGLKIANPALLNLQIFKSLSCWMAQHPGTIVPAEANGLNQALECPDGRSHN